MSVMAMFRQPISDNLCKYVVLVSVSAKRIRDHQCESNSVESLRFQFAPQYNSFSGPLASARASLASSCSLIMPCAPSLAASSWIR